jgi:hypothetical protein
MKVTTIYDLFSESCRKGFLLGFLHTMFSLHKYFTTRFCLKAYKEVVLMGVERGKYY